MGIYTTFCFSEALPMYPFLGCSILSVSQCQANNKKKENNKKIKKIIIKKTSVTRRRCGIRVFLCQDGAAKEHKKESSYYVLAHHYKLNEHFSFSLPTSMMCRSSLFHSPPALLSLPIMHATSEEVTVHEERNTVMNNALT